MANTPISDLPIIAANATEGQEYVFGNGTFKCTSALHFDTPGLILRAAPGTLPTIDINSLSGQRSLYLEGDDMEIHGFRVTNSAIGRQYAQNIETSDDRPPGSHNIYVSGENVKIINCVVDNATHAGIACQEDAPNCLIYGCLIFHNGISQLEHGIYTYGITDSPDHKRFVNNFIFWNASLGLTIHSVGSSGEEGYLIEENAWWNNGLLDTGARNLNLGIGDPIDRLTVRNNYGYQAISGNPDVKFRNPGSTDTLYEDNLTIGGIVPSHGAPEQDDIAGWEHVEGNEVRVHQNTHNTARFHVTVYNVSGNATINLSDYMPVGTRFRLVRVETYLNNLSSGGILTGLVEDVAIPVPMALPVTNNPVHQLMQPVQSGLMNPVSSGDEYAAFILEAVDTIIPPVVVVNNGITVTARRDSWVNTGVKIGTNDSLRVRAQGEVIHDTDPAVRYAYPEGSYNGARLTGIPDPDATMEWGDITPDQEDFIVTNTAPYTLALCVRPEGVTPSDNASGVDNAFRPNRDTTFPAGTLGEGTVWVIFNDWRYGDNSGEFIVNLQKMQSSIDLDIDPGKPSPIRHVPPSILLAKKSPVSRLAWMLAVKPRKGPWEGHTGYDIPLTCPAYSDKLGNLVPPLTYQPNGVSATNIPLEIKLGVKSSDVTILAPKENYDRSRMPTPIIFLEREKIDKNYYEGAEWEMFEVLPNSNRADRLLWQAGHMGNIQLNDLAATIELTSWEELPNRVVGDVLHVLCQVGDRPGERFGTGRCRNELLQNGPHRDNWTTLAWILEPLSYDTLTLGFSDTARSGNPLPGHFVNRLQAGDVEFLNNSSGGRNSGYEVGIKSGESKGNCLIEVRLRLSLPYLPEVGARLYVTSGCTRTKAMCIAYCNLSNARLQELPGNDELIRRSTS
jgi:hypothetical protein